MLPSKILRVRKPKQLTKTLGERAFDYLEKNFIVVIGAASTVFGMCVINAFFFHIEYSPTFDLQAWASIVFSATFVGIALMVMFGILLFLPTFYIGFLSLGTKEIKVDENVKSQFMLRQVLFNFLFSILFALILFALEFKWTTITILLIVSLVFLVSLAIFLFQDTLVSNKKGKLKAQLRENVGTIENTLPDKNDSAKQKLSSKKISMMLKKQITPLVHLFGRK